MQSFCVSQLLTSMPTILDPRKNSHRMKLGVSLFSLLQNKALDDIVLELCANMYLKVLKQTESGACKKWLCTFALSDCCLLRVAFSRDLRNFDQNHLTAVGLENLEYYQFCATFEFNIICQVTGKFGSS